MNYCILNGVKSNDINGLLIQSLPPISKPLIRTQVEEIDGRDGDIVTPLGYSAYNKEMEIGLFGDFDIDDVIAFFDSQGTVTFSNEPDKYYEYQIIEQIDFERLLRFKTATVTFHVQPFKYSTVDTAYTFNNQLFVPQDYTTTKNGVTLSCSEGTISIVGTSTSATEFYLPINDAVLSAGTYTLTATASGNGANACSIRLVDDVPSNAESFGGNYLGLQNDESVSMTATLSASKTFNYFWFYITAGNTMDFNLDVTLENNGVTSFTIQNRGNTVAKPSITISGQGSITLALNGKELFIIALGDAGYITIDAPTMNAVTDGQFMNRYVTGDYDNLVLNVGTNTISWDGNVSKVVVENFSRWI